MENMRICGEHTRIHPGAQPAESAVRQEKAVMDRTLHTFAASIALLACVCFAGQSTLWAQRPASPGRPAAGGAGSTTTGQALSSGSSAWGGRGAGWTASGKWSSSGGASGWTAGQGSFGLQGVHGGIWSDRSALNAPSGTSGKLGASASRTGGQFSVESKLLRGSGLSDSTSASAMKRASSGGLSAAHASGLRSREASVGRGTRSIGFGSRPGKAGARRQPGAGNFGLRTRKGSSGFGALGGGQRSRENQSSSSLNPFAGEDRKTRETGLEP